MFGMKNDSQVTLLKNEKTGIINIKINKKIKPSFVNKIFFFSLSFKFCHYASVYYDYVIFYRPIMVIFINE